MLAKFFFFRFIILYYTKIYLELFIPRIVVGVKFINHDNAIHLQIKQRQISKNGFNRAESKWKPVDVENNNKTIKINYENFFDSQKMFYLDDINIDSDYVVTGILNTN